MVSDKTIHKAIRILKTKPIRYFPPLYLPKVYIGFKFALYISNIISGLKRDLTPAIKQFIQWLHLHNQNEVAL